MFRRLELSELDKAYAIVIEADGWLAHNGMPHWCMPYEVYRKRQCAGENYGLFVRDELAVVVTLCKYKPMGWDDFVSGEVTWLCTLNSAAKFRRQKLGDVMLTQVEAYLSQQKVEVLYLDCYSGFLADYYAAHGFEWLARREFVFEDGNLHDSVLMRKRISHSEII